MGSVCCIAAQDSTLPNRIGGEALQRNVVYSPSWSFRWENRGRVAGEIQNPFHHSSQGIRRNVSIDSKGDIGLERGNLSDGGSLVGNLGTPTSQKSPVHEGKGANSTYTPSDMSMASNYSAEVKDYVDSPEIADTSLPKLSFSAPSAFSTPTTDHLPSQTHTLPPNSNSTPSRRARRSPGHQLFRQVSDSRILGLKSPNNNSISEGRPSFVLSTCSNDLTTGSHGGSSDGWSMRTFSELVASSQRERWSFDSEHLGSERGKLSGSSSRFSYSPSIDMQTCGACSKLLAERSSWNSNDLSVVGVLVCGHVYHAECLETMTLEADRFDPACPICMVGQKQVSKMSRKASKVEAELRARINKISRNRVVDSYLDSDFDALDRRKGIERDRKVPKMESSSSTRTSLAKPFLRRHFSLGSKWARSLSENDSARKKGFWARYRKD